MRLKLQPAAIEDAEAIAALRNAVSDDLTFKHGRGWWTRHHTTAAVLADLRRAQLFVALHRGEAVATLTLSLENPGSADPKLFGKSRRRLYLTALAIAPELQRQGLGRECLAEAAKVARRAKAEAMVLGTPDHPAAGAGGFFTQCGCRETGRARDGDATVIYFELPLGKTR